MSELELTPEAQQRLASRCYPEPTPRSRSHSFSSLEHFFRSFSSHEDRITSASPISYPCNFSYPSFDASFSLSSSSSEPFTKGLGIWRWGPCEEPEYIEDFELCVHFQPVIGDNECPQLPNCSRYQLDPRWYVLWGMWYFVAGDPEAGPPPRWGQFYGEVATFYFCHGRLDHLDPYLGGFDDGVTESCLENDCGPGSFPLLHAEGEGSDAQASAPPLPNWEIDIPWSAWVWCMCEPDPEDEYILPENEVCPHTGAFPADGLTGVGRWVFLGGSAAFGPPPIDGRYYGDVVFVGDCRGACEQPSESSESPSLSSSLEIPETCIALCPDAPITFNDDAWDIFESEASTPAREQPELSMLGLDIDCTIWQWCVCEEDEDPDPTNVAGQLNLCEIREDCPQDLLDEFALAAEAARGHWQHVGGPDIGAFPCHYGRFHGEIHMLQLFELCETGPNAPYSSSPGEHYGDCGACRLPPAILVYALLEGTTKNYVGELIWNTWDETKQEYFTASGVMFNGVTVFLTITMLSESPCQMRWKMTQAASPHTVMLDEIDEPSADNMNCKFFSYRAPGASGEWTVTMPGGSTVQARFRVYGIPIPWWWSWN